MCQGVCNLFTLYLRLNCFQIFLNSNRNSRIYECKNIAFVLTGCCLIIHNSFFSICKSCCFVNIIVHLFELKAAFNFCWLLNYNIIIFLFTPFFLYFLLFFVFLSAILLAFQTCSNLLCFQHKEKCYETLLTMLCKHNCALRFTKQTINSMAYLKFLLSR